jgi:hypothetical protein
LQGSGHFHTFNHRFGHGNIFLKPLRRLTDPASSLFTR